MVGRVGAMDQNRSRRFEPAPGVFSPPDRMPERSAPVGLHMPEQSLPYEMRPDSTTFWRGVGSRALLLLPIIALGVFNAVKQGGAAWAVSLYVVLAAVLLVGVLIMLQTSRIVLTGTTVEKHRFLLRPKVLRRSDVTCGVLVPRYTAGFNRTAPLFVLVDRSGRALLRLTGQTFSAPDLFGLAERLGLQNFDVIDAEVGPKQVTARHRRILPLLERRPVLVITLATLAFLVLMVVAISVFDPVRV